jgi:hypothetical protein
MNQEKLIALREQNWGQGDDTHIKSGEEAKPFIERVGISTLYPVSPEVPNLYEAYIGKTPVAAFKGWDTPVGEVYTWRWKLGKTNAAFYSAIVKKRPTWVSWELVPALFRIRREQNDPEYLYQQGKLSVGAYRIVKALENTSEGVLSTKALRREAGFPIGKTERTEYLKAVEELDSRLLLAKVFSEDPTEENMSHALTALRYPDLIEQAANMSEAEALEQLLELYLPNAVFCAPKELAKHLAISEKSLIERLNAWEKKGRLGKVKLVGYKGECYTMEQIE